MSRFAVAHVWRTAAVVFVAASLTHCGRGNPDTAITSTPFEEVAGLDQRHIAIPPELRQMATARDPVAWTSWVARHKSEVRARLDRGDQDSVVNFMLYGTSFTALPRAIPEDIARASTNLTPAQLLDGRLDQLLAAIASPGANERLRFARQVVERQGIDLSRQDARPSARRFLTDIRSRFFAESDEYRGRLDAANHEATASARLSDYASAFRDRGLSSDTSVRVNFGVEEALSVMRTADPAAGPMRRVAVVGPGLDFTDKAQGHDFYPVQSIQPFAIADSLLRVGLTSVGDLRIVTFDVSARVNEHLRDAHERASRGDAYVVNLPLDRDTDARQSHPALVKYWQRFGDHIGVEVPAAAPGPSPSAPHVRAVGIRPEVVKIVSPRDLDIVIERLDPLPPAEQFDLIIATNVLVYYDAFEQALAMANISKMLKPGGRLLLNHAVSSAWPLEPSTDSGHAVSFDRLRTPDRGYWYRGDTFFWYRKR